MKEQFCQFLQVHWQGLSVFASLFFISFVNALPERKEDFDSYSVAYHTMRGLIPMSRQSAPLASSAVETPRVVVGVKK